MKRLKIFTCLLLIMNMPSAWSDGIDEEFLGILLDDVPRSIEQDQKINGSIFQRLLDKIKSRKNGQLGVIKKLYLGKKESSGKRKPSDPLASQRKMKNDMVETLESLRDITKDDPIIDKAVKKIEAAFKKIEKKFAKGKKIKWSDRNDFNLIFFDVSSDTRILEEKYDLPQLPPKKEELVEGLEVDPVLAVKVRERVEDKLLTNYQGPETGTPISYEVRRYLAQLISDTYWTYHAPLKESLERGGKLFKKFSKKRDGPFKGQIKVKASTNLKKMWNMGSWIGVLDGMAEGFRAVSNVGPDIDCSARTSGLATSSASRPTKVGMIKGSPTADVQYSLPPNFCSKFPKDPKCQLNGGKIILDPGHLGGKATTDFREFRNYREGHGNFVTSYVLRYILNACLKIPSDQIIVTRSDLFSVADVQFTKDKKGKYVPIPVTKMKSKGKKVGVWDNGEFRKAYVRSITSDNDVLLSVHTDGVPKQVGTVYHSRGAEDPASYYIKTEKEVARSRNLAGNMVEGLNAAFFDGDKSNYCRDIIRFQKSGYSLGTGDYGLLRSASKGSGVIVEGFSHTDTSLVEEMVEARKDIKGKLPYVKKIKVKGKNYSFHSIFQCYAQGLAHGLVKQLECEQ